MGDQVLQRIGSYESAEVCRGESPSSAIGSGRRRQSITLARIGVDNGVPVYVGETAAVDVYGMRRSLEAEDGCWASWWRLEAKAPMGAKARSLDPKRGETLVMAEHPRGSGWFTTGRFLPPIKDGAAANRPTPARSDLAAITSLEAGLQKDPWETGEYLTAGLTSPGMDYELGLREKSRKAVRYLYGVVEDLPQVVGLLLSKESEPGRELESQVRRIVQTGRTAIGDYVAPHVAAPESIGQLMQVSVHQALAGPMDEDERKLAGEGLHKLVMEILDDHVRNATRHEISQAQKVHSLDAEGALAAASLESVASAPFAIDDATRLIEGMLERKGARREAAGVLLAPQIPELALNTLMSVLADATYKGDFAKVLALVAMQRDSRGFAPNAETEEEAAGA